MLDLFRTSRLERQFARRGVPLTRNQHGALCFRPETGAGADPVIIVSVPKSGTYLFGAILAALGVQAVDIHIATDGFQDLRHCSQEAAVAQGADFFIAMPCEQVLPLVQPGQYLVSHFPCEPRVLGQLPRFKTIFTYRNLRDVLVSVMRWVARKAQLGEITEGWERLPDGADKMQFFMELHAASHLANFRTMRDWRAQPGVLSLSFEEIQGDFGRAAQVDAVVRLLAFLHLERTAEQIDTVLARSLGKETLTYSGKRSQSQHVWSSKVEAIFQQHGGAELDACWHRPTVLAPAA